MDVEVLTQAELVSRAGSVARARGLVRVGLWRRVVRGAYVDAVHGDSPELRLTVLRRVIPGGVALSHRTVLWVLGRDVLVAGLLDVTVERGRHLVAGTGLRTHTAALPSWELVEIGGLLRTSVSRAVIDVARAEAPVEAVGFGDEALRSGATTTELLAASLEAAVGLRGVLAARAALPFLDGRAESPMESRLRMGLRIGGLTGLDVQYDVYDDGGHAGRADLHLDGVLVEYDGRAERLQKPVFTAERRRQNRLADTAMEIRRFTAPDYYRLGPYALAAVVRRALDIASTRDRSGLRQGPDTLRPPMLTPLPTLVGVPSRRAA